MCPDMPCHKMMLLLLFHEIFDLWAFLFTNLVVITYNDAPTYFVCISNVKLGFFVTLATASYLSAMMNLDLNFPAFNSIRIFEIPQVRVVVLVFTLHLLYK